MAKTNLPDIQVVRREQVSRNQYGADRLLSNSEGNQSGSSQILVLPPLPIRDHEVKPRVVPPPPTPPRDVITTPAAIRNGAGEISVANPFPPPAIKPPAPNLGWNGGAHSLERIPPGWTGVVAFDVPDIQGSRPAGVAVGLTPYPPARSRNGYQHLSYGLVFTESLVRVMRGGATVGSHPYGMLRAARTAGETDEVLALVYENLIKWVVNGVTLHSEPFFSRSYALDATLYAPYDSVDNPRFLAGDWSERPGFSELEDGSLNLLLPALSMTGDGTTQDELNVSLPPLVARLSTYAYADMSINLPRLRLTAGEADGLTLRLPRFAMMGSESSQYSAISVALPSLSMEAEAEDLDPYVTYSFLSVALPPFSMTATVPSDFNGMMELPALTMRASYMPDYAEMAINLPPMTALAYGGGSLLLADVVELVAGYVPVIYSATVSMAIIEGVEGDSTVVLSAAVSLADATEKVTTEDSMSVLQTFLAQVIEQVGVARRITMHAIRVDGDVPAEGGDAWAVNTRTNATTRYDRFDFNSFAAMGGRHYGVKADGVYLLEGSTDDGRNITSGVALGTHDFGTQQLKGLQNVYVGVSSRGRMFLKVNDGERTYTYCARNSDPHMKTQRIDVGRGLRANYFTFDLTCASDAFELETVTFRVLASNRRI